jgi:hypothetical protein
MSLHISGLRHTLRALHLRPRWRLPRRKLGNVKTSATLRGVLALASRCLVLMYKVAICHPFTLCYAISGTLFPISGGRPALPVLCRPPSLSSHFSNHHGRLPCGAGTTLRATIYFHLQQALLPSIHMFSAPRRKLPTHVQSCILCTYPSLVVFAASGPPLRVVRRHDIP